MLIPSFILQLIAGAAGGYIVGAAFTALTWGRIGDLIAGLGGGAIGGHILEHLWAGDPYASDIEIYLSSLIGGFIGGMLMLAILGAIKTMLKR